MRKLENKISQYTNLYGILETEVIKEIGAYELYIRHSFDTKRGVSILCQTFEKATKIQGIINYIRIQIDILNVVATITNKSSVDNTVDSVLEILSNANFDEIVCDNPIKVIIRESQRKGELELSPTEDRVRRLLTNPEVYGDKDIDAKYLEDLVYEAFFYIRESEMGLDTKE